MSQIQSLIEINSDDLTSNFINNKFLSKEIVI